MKLHISPVSPNSRKARAIARTLDLDVREVVVDLKAGEQRSETFLRLNPNGLVPVLEDGDVVLFESNAIAWYLAESAGSALLPSDVRGRARVAQWLAWEGWHLAHPILDLAFERLIKGMIGAGPPDQAVVDKALAGYARFGAVLDRHLAGGSWLLGDTLTIADFCLAADFTFAIPSELPLGETPHVRRWLDAMDELPAWRDTAPPLG